VTTQGLNSSPWQRFTSLKLIGSSLIDKKYNRMKRFCGRPSKPLPEINTWRTDANAPSGQQTMFTRQMYKMVAPRSIVVEVKNVR